MARAMIIDAAFMPDQIARSPKRPRRVFIAHSCNQPYLMPTVKIIGPPYWPAAILGAADAWANGEPIKRTYLKQGE